VYEFYIILYLSRGREDELKEEKKKVKFRKGKAEGRKTENNICGERL
jgi:hypothetical protein